MVLHGYRKYFFGVNVKTLKLIGGRRFLAARSALKVIAIAGWVDAGTQIHSVLFSIKKSLKVPKNTVFNHLNVRTYICLHKSYK